MCRLSGSFVYHRFKNDAWPLIRSYMLDQSKYSKKAGKGYHHLSAFAYQKTILQWSV